MQYYVKRAKYYFEVLEMQNTVFLYKVFLFFYPESLFMPLYSPPRHPNGTNIAY